MENNEEEEKYDEMVNKKEEEKYDLFDECCDGDCSECAQYQQEIEDMDIEK
ncbi:MAG TPA: hypothetical protein PLM63_00475 [bacterium]|jgi:hypothetical protein|nr:hypothetical protein [bacterium]HPO11051.1 hypothetical protein [bacterium]